MRVLLALVCVLAVASCSSVPASTDAFGDPPVLGSPPPSSSEITTAGNATPRGRSYATVRAPVGYPFDAEVKTPRPSSAPAPLPYGVMIGHVTDAQGDPIAGVCVEAFDVVTQTVAYGTMTDAEGLYRLIGASGRYEIRVCETELFSAGLLSRIADVRFSGLRGLDIVLQQKGRLTGRVKDALGLPLAGVCVIVDDVQKDVSDLLGSYTVLIDAGTYAVTFTACQPPASTLGYADEVLEPITVRAGGTTRLDETLAPVVP